MLKNLKSLFIVEDEDTKKQKGDEKNDSVKKTTTNKQNNSNPIPQGKIDEAISTKLLQAIEANNQEGFDYLEYKKSLKSLEKLPMDEATKYRSAFATASTMGVTLNKLLDSAQFYLSVLEKEQQKFTSASNGQFKASIDKKNEEVELLKKMIADKSEQIKKLTQEIGQHQAKVETTVDYIADAKHRIEATKNNFNSTWQSLKAQIEQDTVNMKQFLK